MLRSAAFLAWLRLPRQITSLLAEVRAEETRLQEAQVETAAEGRVPQQQRMIQEGLERRTQARAEEAEVRRGAQEEREARAFSSSPALRQM